MTIEAETFKDIPEGYTCTESGVSEIPGEGVNAGANPQLFAAEPDIELWAQESCLACAMELI